MPRPGPVGRGLALVACLVLAAFGGGVLSAAVADLLAPGAAPGCGAPGCEATVRRLIAAACVVYALLMAVPFVPGVELGLGLLAALGPSVAPLVYVSTLAGLTLAFIVGRAVPPGPLARALSALSLTRAASLVRLLAPLSREERLAFLAGRGPRRLSPYLLRHRYLALAALLNLPGNIVIGGGGGLALAAGLSRVFSLPGFLATIGLATSPVPVAVLVAAARGG